MKRRPAGGGRHVGRLQEVVRVGDDERIERVGDAADRRSRGRAPPRSVAEKKPPSERGERAGGGQAHDQHAAVHAVGDPADRELEDAARRCRSPRRRPRSRATLSPFCGAEDRGHAEDRRRRRRRAGRCRRSRAARCGRAGRSDIGLVVWKARRAMPASSRIGVKADRDQHRHDDEERVARRVGEVQDALRRDDADHLHDHVERQRLAAGLVGGGVVQPALGHDVDAGEAEADDEAQRDPDPDVGRRGVEDEGGRDQRGERREDPDVADAARSSPSPAASRRGSRRSRRSSPATWWRRRSPRSRRGCRAACPAGRCRAAAAACRAAAPRSSSGPVACESSDAPVAGRVAAVGRTIAAFQPRGSSSDESP